MKRLFLSLFLAIAILAALALGIRFWQERAESKELVLYGNVDVRQVEMGFRVAGEVTDLFFEEGDAVKKGDLLARLSETPYDKQLVEAEANEAAIKVTYENAKILLERRKELIQTGGVSQEDYQNSDANYNQLASSYKQAQAATAVAKDNLAYTRIYAPVDGVILTRIREPGTVVNPSDPVYTVSVTSPVWIRAYVDEPHLGQIYYGMAAEIYTDTPGAKVYQGHIGFISPVAEFTPKTVQTAELRTDLVYRLRIYAENPDRGLLQGMPVTVKMVKSAQSSP